MADSSRHFFRSYQRLRTRAQFQCVQTHGKTFYSRYFTVMFHSDSAVTMSRLGIITSRRYGQASERSRIRRLIRETFRVHQHEFLSTQDILVIPKPNAKNLKYDILRNDLLKLWEKANFLKIR
ncbi:MAG: ribonuclease P protein component [Verrucomicrobiae bacterium]|nr:ribonuclease P protein component [Verrucomicrobiae bacterium]